MTVRDATITDLGQIAAMIVELAAFEGSPGEVTFDADELGHHLFGPEPAARVLISEPSAEPRGEPPTVAGMALWYPTFSTWVGRPGIWLEDLWVRPAHRRAGLAGELMAALAARTTGRVEWSVLDWNLDAIAFYDGLGAVPVPGWTRYRWGPGAGDATKG
jgi:GNAT superfamily N-acetyltransferase